MNAQITVFSLVISLLCTAAYEETRADSIRWAPDIVSAREAAAKFKVPLVVHFYGDGCIPCRTLEQRVFSQPEVINTMNHYFICVAVNGTKEPNVAAEFAVHSWPTDVFLAPDGELIYRGISPQDVREFMSVLTNVAVANRDRNLILASKKAATEANSNPNPQPFAGNNLDTLKTSHPELAGLPRLGAHSASVTSTPNFYAASDQKALTQQLTASTAPRNDVQCGPAVPSNQPEAISGPTELPLLQTPSLGTTPVGNPSRNETLANSSLATEPALQHSQLPDLPGLKATVPIQHRQESEHRLANSPGIPTLQSSLPHHSNLTVTGSPKSGTSGPFHLSSTTTTTLRQGLPTNTSPSKTDTTEPSSQPMISEMELSTKGSSQSEQPNLDGFCPVALRQQKWQPGNSAFSVKHRGRIYWMSSESAVDVFLREPDQYAPVLSGYDPQVLLYQGKLVSGSTQYGLFEANSGQVLLFSSQESKDEFQKNFEKNMRALTAVRDRAFGQRGNSVD